MGKKPSHIHKYKKQNISRKGVEPFYVFRCVKTDCTHYIAVTLSEGKVCECNRCGDPMILTKSSIELTRPHCNACVKRKKVPNAETVAAINKFLADI